MTTFQQLDLTIEQHHGVKRPTKPPLKINYGGKRLRDAVRSGTDKPRRAGKRRRRRRS